MNLQDVIWGIALAGMGLVALGFLYVIIQAGKPADDAARAKSARTARQLQGWLFGALAEGGVELPGTFDLRGIVKLLASLFGLTWTNIRTRLVRQIGERAMAMALTIANPRPLPGNSAELRPR